MAHPDKNAIRRSSLTIYDHIPAGRPDLYIASKKLEGILQESLVGISLSGLALRTRSKVVKTEVCKAIGYPVPGSFKRTQPRFPGQNFDVYIQKSNNLQIWNEELDASRRYVIVRVDEDNRIGNVRVISGAELAKMDRTGTLTQKYQATLDVGAEACELVSKEDAIPAELIGRESSARLIDPTEDPSLSEKPNAFQTNLSTVCISSVFLSDVHSKACFDILISWIAGAESILGRGNCSTYWVMNRLLPAYNLLLKLRS